MLRHKRQQVAISKCCILAGRASDPLVVGPLRITSCGAAASGKHGTAVVHHWLPPRPDACVASQVLHDVHNCTQIHHCSQRPVMIMIMSVTLYAALQASPYSIVAVADCWVLLTWGYCDNSIDWQYAPSIATPITSVISNITSINPDFMTARDSCRRSARPKAWGVSTLAAALLPETACCCCCFCCSWPNCCWELPESESAPHTPCARLHVQNVLTAAKQQNPCHYQ